MTTAASKKKKPSRKAIPSGKGLTFEKVWAMMQETDRQMKETDRILKESDERFRRKMEESADLLNLNHNVWNPVLNAGDQFEKTFTFQGI